MNKVISYLRALVNTLLGMLANLLPDKNYTIIKDRYGRNSEAFSRWKRERFLHQIRQVVFPESNESLKLLLASDSGLNIKSQNYHIFFYKEKNIKQERAPCRKRDYQFSVHKSVWSIICSLPLLLLLPYLTVMFFQGNDNALTIRRFDIDDILPYIVERQISSDYERETIKCQAVIARSNYFRKISNGMAYWECINEIYDLKSIGMLDCFYRLLWDHNYEKYQKAVEETKKKVLQYHGEWKIIPYHEISNGRTRDGEEVFHSKEYAYLKSVYSREDQNAPDYCSISVFSEDRIPKNLQILSKDSEGYVLCLTTDGKPIEGESFRESFQLASTDFSFQKIRNHQYKFVCKGKGHGLGMSQYGANVLAKGKQKYDQIIRTYFPEMNLCEIEKEA